MPFHLAIPVTELAEAKEFYGSVLGLEEGRSDEVWQDYSLFGHQLVVHEVSSHSPCSHVQDVDGDHVPVPHFGVCLTEQQFHTFSQKLRANKVQFIIEPHRRFQGTAGEQWTMFFKDPSHNNLEFKAMVNPENLFAKGDES
eukprot:CAMPEP_0206195678 /NCGR_PEP_ID=MMETSP0166-20121206/7993_1 /ASSEMBLY_ACC=CAM_ASM_000260 /TAXON_ID=95228 /ORGANISM="Vannella robusta, Strain DIVA3 518/3/11/1/6" /LENGTH=140 /DNA_ID=CAMNT_0053613003 /DNA_START=387 /DNA_END=805 /DNA_ORIENTATION=-